MTSTVLVTGASGFLGSHVAMQLSRRGDDVRVLVRETSDLTRLEGLPVELRYGDVTDRDSVFRAAEGVDVVIHCAAMVDIGARDISRMYDANVNGARNVLEAAVANGAVGVHCSSVSVYGDTGDQTADEEFWNETETNVGYYRIKREAHLVARELADQGGRIRIGVPGGIYGPGDSGDMMPVLRAYVTLPIPVAYVPTQHQSLVNVDDCADGLIRIADSGVDGREYILCADIVTVREWFGAIAEASGRRPPSMWLSGETIQKLAGSSAKVIDRVGGNSLELAEIATILSGEQSFSGERMRTELGWNPRSLQQGMNEVAESIWLEKLAAKRAKAAARAGRPSPR